MQGSFFLGLFCVVFTSALAAGKEAPVPGRRISIRNIQAYENGRLLAAATYQLSIFNLEVDTVESRLNTGTTVVYPNSTWIIKRNGIKYHVDAVANYVRYANTYDLRIDFSPNHGDLDGCLDVVYRNQCGELMRLNWNSPHTKLYCQRLTFIPVKKLK